jgi:hypothetical protein
MLTLFTWLEKSSLAEALRSGDYYYQIVEVTHYFSMFALIGSIVVTDFSVLGWPKRRDPGARVGTKLFSWTWISLAVVVITGILLMLPTAVDMYENRALRLKMLLIVLALIAHVILQSKLAKTNLSMNAASDVKIAALISLILWISTILGGTEIAFHPHLG